MRIIFPRLLLLTTAALAACTAPTEPPAAETAAPRPGLFRSERVGAPFTAPGPRTGPGRPRPGSYR